MKRKLVALLCTVTMMVSLLSGCGDKPAQDGGKEESSAESSSGGAAGGEQSESKETQEQSQPEEEEGKQAASDLEYVELDWYIDAVGQPDQEMVQDALNEYLLEKLNMNVKLHFMSWDEYGQKVKNMLQTGEDAGIVSFDSNVVYNTHANMGAFYPIDELWDEYGTGVKGLFSEDVWKAMSVNGHIYGVPILKDNSYIMGYIYNADLAEELELDMDNLGWKNYMDAEDFLVDALKRRNEKHPEWEGMPLTDSILPIVPSYYALETFVDLMAVCNIPGIDDVEGYDANTVFNFYETEEYKEFCLQQQRLIMEGVFAYDYAQYPTINYEPSTLLSRSWGYTWIDEHLYGEDFRTKLVVFDNVWSDTGNYTSAGSAISANCKNPERAMMLLDLANTDPYIATLLRFGIEGEHYFVDENGKKSLEGGRNSDVSNPGWLYWYGIYFGNVTITDAPESYSGPDNAVFKKMIEYNNSAKLAAHMGFVLDTSNIQNEIAACTNVVSGYIGILNGGKSGTPEEVIENLDKLNADLKANGVDKIVAEVQAQIDAWNSAQ